MSLLLVGSGAAARALAGEAWKKNSSDWSQKDIDAILSKSPWAKAVTVEFKVGDLAHPEKRGGGIPTGPPSSGVDNQGGSGTRSQTGGNPIGGAPVGRGGIPAEAGDLPKFQAVVRWDSAAPIRRARKSDDSAMPENHYVIGVSGFPIMPPKADAGDSGEDLRRYTRLERAGKASLYPASIESHKGGALRITFDGTANPITDADREVLFIVSTGSLEGRVRFYPREMTFEGKLAL